MVDMLNVCKFIIRICIIILNEIAILISGIVQVLNKNYNRIMIIEY